MFLTHHSNILLIYWLLVFHKMTFTIHLIFTCLAGIMIWPLSTAIYDLAHEFYFGVSYFYSFEGDNSGPDPSGCKHTPVCVIRQPHPPPYPSITHLVNEVTKYHEHMMTRAGVPGRYPGCERCMNAYSKNYGCQGCIWLKWHGELHGYPDIHPSDYKKHLDPTVWEELRSRLYQYKTLATSR